MRRVILTAVVALLVVSSGCVGLVTGDTVEFEASEGAVSDSALDSTGYDLNNSSERAITRNVSFFGQERTIRIVNRVNRYTSSGSLADAAGNETLAENETLQDAAGNETLASNQTLQDAVAEETGGDTEIAGLKRFVVVSSPGASVAGRTLNPAASWSNDRILEQVAEQTGQLSDIEQQDTRTVASLGEERNVTEFSATTQIEGREVDVQAHVVSFEHDGDVIIAVAVHPDQFDESDNVDELVGGLEHSGN
ncbi:DUF6517 family protein [Haloarcula sediminis]|uniref:DUF6517 family protein n=1 Tax=Haloarcula sediminis TaxID=3111777 RepID=UPI002D78A289|nr:DUF6517 family protein [Haloarcula sp. CK38]